MVQTKKQAIVLFFLLNFLASPLLKSQHDVQIPSIPHIPMVYVEGGEFVMGCEDHSDNCIEFQKPAHQVRLDGFYLGQYEISQAEWEAVMGEGSANHVLTCPKCPVTNISWYEAQAFCERLTTLTGQIYRLPTEAEWEFAARGGVKSKGFTFAGGNNLEELAWYNENSEGETHKIGLKLPNELGFYDLSGNVYEWV